VLITGTDCKINKALLLDRDGVINVHHGYVHEVKCCHFLDGIFDLTRLATRENHIICIVTKQQVLAVAVTLSNTFMITCLGCLLGSNRREL
jgi:histidinol phosphatase-like enzyme